MINLPIMYRSSLVRIAIAISFVGSAVCYGQVFPKRTDVANQLTNLMTEMQTAHQNRTVFIYSKDRMENIVVQLEQSFSGDHKLAQIPPKDLVAIVTFYAHWTGIIKLWARAHNASLNLTEEAVSEVIISALRITLFSNIGKPDITRLAEKQKEHLARYLVMATDTLTNVLLNNILDFNAPTEAIKSLFSIKNLDDTEADDFIMKTTQALLKQARSVSSQSLDDSEVLLLADHLVARFLAIYPEDQRHKLTAQDLVHTWLEAEVTDLQHQDGIIYGYEPGKAEGELQILLERATWNRDSLHMHLRRVLRTSFITIK